MVVIKHYLILTNCRLIKNWVTKAHLIISVCSKLHYSNNWKSMIRPKKECVFPATLHYTHMYLENDSDPAVLSGHSDFVLIASPMDSSTIS